MNDHWLVRPATVRLLWRAFIALLVAVVVAGLLVERSVHFDVESLFGFYAWYGFIACAGMILFAKAVGVLIKRRDDYYEKGDFPD